MEARLISIEADSRYGLSISINVNAGSYTYQETYDIPTRYRTFWALGGVIADIDEANICEEAAKSLCKLARKSYRYRKIVRDAHERNRENIAMSRLIHDQGSKIMLNSRH